MFTTARQSLRGGDIIASVTRPFMRLHWSLQTLGVLLIPQETLTTRRQSHNSTAEQDYSVKLFVSEGWIK